MARFKKRKGEIVLDAKAAAERAFIRQFEDLKSKSRYGGYVNKDDICKHDNLSIQENLMLKAISSAIEAAVEEIVESIYTDDEFERDIGLTT